MQRQSARSARDASSAPRPNPHDQSRSAFSSHSPFSVARSCLDRSAAVALSRSPESRCGTARRCRTWPVGRPQRDGLAHKLFFLLGGGRGGGSLPKPLPPVISFAFSFFSFFSLIFPFRRRLEGPGTKAPTGNQSAHALSSFPL